MLVLLLIGNIFGLNTLGGAETLHPSFSNRIQPMDYAVVQAAPSKQKLKDATGSTLFGEAIKASVEAGHAKEWEQFLPNKDPVPPQPVYPTFKEMIYVNFIDSLGNNFGNTGLWESYGAIFHSQSGRKEDYKVTEQDIEFVKRELPGQADTQRWILYNGRDQEHIHWLVNQKKNDEERKKKLTLWRRRNYWNPEDILVRIAGGIGFMIDPLKILLIICLCYYLRKKYLEHYAVDLSSRLSEFGTELNFIFKSGRKGSVPKIWNHLQLIAAQIAPGCSPAEVYVAIDAALGIVLTLKLKNGLIWNNGMYYSALEDALNMAKQQFCKENIVAFEQLVAYMLAFMEGTKGNPYIQELFKQNCEVSIEAVRDSNQRHLDEKYDELKQILDEVTVGEMAFLCLKSAGDDVKNKK